MVWCVIVLRCSVDVVYTTVYALVMLHSHGVLGTWDKKLKY